MLLNAPQSTIQTRHRTFLLSVRYFCCSYISVGVVLGDIAVSSWATLLCRRGRHCGVVAGDIAPELCTGQKGAKHSPYRSLGFGAKPRLIAALELCTKKEIKKKENPPHPLKEKETEKEISRTRTRTSRACVCEYARVCICACVRASAGARARERASHSGSGAVDIRHRCFGAGSVRSICRPESSLKTNIA